MRTGKISVENLSGGELTSAPLLATPSKYSRLLQNFYINTEGHIKKVPGWSPISNQVSGIQITAGLEFKKTDGTTIILIGGRSGSAGRFCRVDNQVIVPVKTDFSNTNKIYFSQVGDIVVISNNQDVPVSYDGTTVGAVTMPGNTSTVLFTGSGLNDLSVTLASAAAVVYLVEIDGVGTVTITPTFTGSGVNNMTVPNPNYSGGAACTFDVVMDSAGSGDTLKYNLNGGAFTTGQALSTGTAQEYVNHINYASGGTWPTEQALTGSEITVGGINISNGTTGNNLANTFQVNLVEEFTAGAWRYVLYGLVNGSQTGRLISVQPDTFYNLGFGFNVKITSANFTANARNTSFRFANRATDIGVGYLKAVATTGNNNTDQYEIQMLGDLSYQWRKNGGSWTVKTISSANFMGYDTIDSAYSIRFKNWTGNTVGATYLFQVDGAATPDTYKWRKNSEAYTTTVAIVSGPVLLKEGIFIQFASFTGHTNADAWAFAPAQDTVKTKIGAAAYTTGIPITGALQTIASGIQFKFSSINGHTLNDKWTIPVSQTLRFGKSYTYKNRLWIIASDKLTAYHSALSLPTDFTGTGSGYLDFRYVISTGDELVDISSMLNYQVFFMKNHVVVYSGSDPTDAGDYAIQQVIPETGVISTDCIVNVGSDIYFLSSRGVKGLKQVLNTGALDVNNVSAPIDADIVAAISANTDGIYSSGHYPDLGLIFFQIGTTIFTFNYRNGSWSRIVVPSTNDVSKILSMFKGSSGELYMGGYDYLFKFNPATTTYNFNSQAPSYKWTGPMWKATTAESMFLSEMVLRLASTTAATLTLKVRGIGFDTEVEDQSTFNEQTLQVSAITTLNAVFNFVTAPLYGAGKYVQIEISETPVYVDNADLEIAGVEISGELGIR